MSISKKKQIRSWVMYDWANSSFATTVLAGFFPLFFKEYWSFGTDSITSTARLGAITSASGLMVAILVPFLGSLSDRRQSKKLFLAFSTMIGVGGTIALGFIDKGEWALAMSMFGLAFVGFSATSTFYDALLPQLGTDAEMDSISARGFAFGYLGGGVLFALNVLMFLRPPWFGIESQASAVKWSFISVGIWWIIFGIPLFLFVPEPTGTNSKGSVPQGVMEGLKGVQVTVSDIIKDKVLMFYLIAFWLYIDGVYTIISMAVDFGLSIGLKSQDLIAALLLVQFVGFPGGLLFGKLAQKINPMNLIAICVAAYAAVTILASMMTTSVHFYILAASIGLFQGGVQSLSRSVFAKLIPTERSGEFFGFQNLVGKFASILGPFLVGATAQLTGDHRLSILSLLILFFGGLYFLLKSSRLKKLGLQKTTLP